MASGLSPAELPFLSALADSVQPGDRELWLRVAADYLAVDSGPSAHRDATIKAAIDALRASDEATRAAFARRLAPHAAASDALAALAALGGEAALIVLGEGATLSRERVSAAAKGEPSAAQAAAQRADLDARLITALIERDEIDVTLTLARNAEAPIDAAQFTALARRAEERRIEKGDKRLIEALLARQPARIEQAALFFEADAAQRAHIVAAAQRAILGRRYPAALSPDAANVTARLERCALEGDWRRFDLALAAEFGCEDSAAARISADPGGEPLAVALAALGAPADASVRILAARDLQEGRDYRRIAALARLKDALNPAAARLVMAAMIGASMEKQVREKQARHRPQFDQTAEAAPSRPSTSGRRGEADPAIQRRRRAFALTSGRRLGDERA
ncbi:MAG: DUF2336 domain-containing protein [Bradyrhizobium sp.]|nr:MAG: DUF2336 domain-containing protein [Bradyrhizobium sp.]